MQKKKVRIPKAFEKLYRYAQRRRLTSCGLYSESVWIPGSRCGYKNCASHMMIKRIVAPRPARKFVIQPHCKRCLFSFKCLSAGNTQGPLVIVFMAYCPTCGRVEKIR